MVWTQLNYSTWKRKSDGVILRFFSKESHYSYGSYETEVYTTHPDYASRFCRKVKLKDGSERNYYVVDSFKSLKKAKEEINKLKKTLKEVEQNGINRN